VNAATRGAFVFREDMKLSDVTDGLSKKILVGEIVTNRGDRDCHSSPAVGLGSQTSEMPVRGGIFDASREGIQFTDPTM